MKFRNPKDSDKKSKKTIYFVIVIVFLMVSSVVGFVIFSGAGNDDNQTTADFEYNGYGFTKLNSGWLTKINQADVYFDYLPTEVSEINYNKEEKLSISSKVYLAYDPAEKDSNMDFILGKIDQNLRILGYTTNLACVNEQNCPDIPIVDCNNNQNVLLIKIGETNRIYKQDGCLFVEGEDIIGVSKSSDKFIYSITGVM